MPVGNLEIVVKELERSKGEVRKQHQKVMARLARDGIMFVARKSPVKSGAYRARHEVLANRRVVYRHPNYPKKKRYPQDKLQFKQHSPPGVRQSVMAAPSFASITFRNRSTYAGKVELKHGPYRLLYDYLFQRAETLSKRPLGIEEFEEF
jgi:hypothetical protein